ncbi:O-antigen ligase family protein [Paraglaciecola agarilytica]|uniref:O-antigen ligase family protein n=1 Tax=Paraglaciecola chathamensis TaxID=368405 RepID=UPI001C0800B2|nr:MULTISPECIES: O-antigen ligase family protein [Paraglaciecola]MBU3017178.1 O-antigen ligase family protein [Paraglaciecola agarilytica]MDO6558280.1 O-antigen ligase family protein [Paraglaciecola chathamensis]MDO6838889.1 O-antigen ligase family protein [Paraglaciecola chathamensis]
MLNILLYFGCYFGGFVASLAYSPIYIFVAYQAIYFFNPEKRWWGDSIPDISYSFYLSIFMLGLFVVTKSRLIPSRLFSAPQMRWAFSILFLYGCAYTYAVFKDFHLEYLIGFLKLLVIISVAYKLCDSSEKFKKVLYGFIFGAWYMSFYTWQIGRNSGGRVENIGPVDAPDANGAASVIAPSLVLCLYFFWTHPSKLAKLSFVIAGAFIANALVLINSRGAFLGVALGCGYFMFHMYFSSFQRKRQKMTAVFVTIFGLFGILYVADDAFIERMSSITQETQAVESRETGATRTIFWMAAWDMAKEHPLGAGYRGFNYFSPLYIPKEYNTGGNMSRTVHSTWFEALSEIGYLGLFALIMMIIMVFKSYRRCRYQLRKDQDVDNYFLIIALESSLISFIIIMTFLNRLRAEILYWSILYSAIAFNLFVIQKQTTKRGNYSSAKSDNSKLTGRSHVQQNS